MEYKAYNPSSPGGLIALADSMLEADELDHNMAVEMAIAIREMIVSLSTAVALVTHMQNPEQPILRLSPNADEEFTGCNPCELLEALIGGWREEENESFEKLIVEYKKYYNEKQTVKEISKIPEDYFVEDILGEKKND